MTDNAIPPRYLQVLKEVAKEHKVPVSWMFAQDRKRDAAWPRQAAYARIRQTTMPNGKPPSYPLIGRWMGGRDHSTIIEGIEHHKARISRLENSPLNGVENDQISLHYK